MTGSTKMFWGIIGGLMLAVMLLIVMPILIDVSSTASWATYEGAADYLESQGYYVWAASGLTSGRVPISDGTKLVDDADLSFSTDTLTITKITTTQITNSGLTSGRVLIGSTGGLITDDAGLTYNAATNALTTTSLYITDVILSDGGTLKPSTADNQEYIFQMYDKDGGAYIDALTAYSGVNTPYWNWSIGFNISNNKYISFSDGSGVSRNVLGMETNNVYLTSSQGTMLVQYATAQDISFWGSTAGTSRIIQLLDTTATNGQANDSPTLGLTARYDSDAGAGVTSTSWVYRVAHDMITAGAAPKSQAIHSINGVSALALQNDNGAISHYFYTGAGVNSLIYSAGVMTFNEATQFALGGNALTITTTDFVYLQATLSMANTKSILATYNANDTFYIKVRNTADASNKTAIQFKNTGNSGEGALMSFYGATPVPQQTKATHSNWAALGDVVQALVDLGLFDTP